jgi:heme-degrading monooxygenase HmoA
MPSDEESADRPAGRAGAGHHVLTVFRSRLRPDAHAYPHVAERMDVLAARMPGFVEAKTYTSADGERVTVVVFDSWPAHEGWRRHPEHIEAQRQGRAEFYEYYRIDVAETVRGTSWRCDEGGSLR